MEVQTLETSTILRLYRV